MENSAEPDQLASDLDLHYTNQVISGFSMIICEYEQKMPRSLTTVYPWHKEKETQQKSHLY